MYVRYKNKKLDILITGCYDNKG